MRTLSTLSLVAASVLAAMLPAGTAAAEVSAAAMCSSSEVKIIDRRGGEGCYRGPFPITFKGGFAISVIETGKNVAINWRKKGTANWIHQPKGKRVYQPSVMAELSFVR